MSITTHTLSCGLRLLVEHMPAMQSAALTWSCPAGSATEPESLDGRSAMFEELLVRGAGSRSSREAADAFDRIGATRDSASAALMVRVASTFVASRLPEVMPLIVDMIRDPRMDEASVDACRDLAIQAIESLADDPHERAAILLKERHLPFPLGRSGMGTPEGLAACTSEVLRREWRDRARPVGSILGIAGNVRPDEVIGLLDPLLEGWHGASRPPEIATHAPRGYAHEEDETNQVQILIAHDGPSEGHEDSPLEKLTLAVLSGGMSSRLFSEVREKRGLCYSVNAGYRGERDFGMVSAFVGTTPQRAQESLDVLLSELRRINTSEGRVSPDELERARTSLKSSLVFAGESTGARAASLVSDQHRLGRPRTLEEMAREIEAITLDQLNAYLTRRDLGRLTIQTLGPAPLVPPAGM